MVKAQASKRVALEFAEVRRASWDHRKLGGTYLADTAGARPARSGGQAGGPL